MDEISLLGIRIDRVTVDEALRLIEERISERRPTHVVTADASMVVLARHDPELARIVCCADLVTPDGSGIVWASRLLRMPIAERVSGVDLVAHLCRLSASSHPAHRLYFLGAAPDVAQKAAERLSAKYPGADIVGARHGFFSVEEEPQVVAEIAGLGPDIVFVAFGIPKQEKFIERNKVAMGASIYIGVGGSFDVHSGLVTRAPVWMQNAGLEWIYRLWQNPKKISKVMMLPRFVVMVLRERVRTRA